MARVFQQTASGGARAWLGVHIQSVTPNVSNSTATGPTQGAVVVDKPDPRSPAAAAGIEIGDVITAINGQSVTGASYLSQRSAAMAGTSLPLTIIRNGKPKTLWIVPSKVPDHEPAANSTPQPATNLTQPAANSTSAYADASAAINREDYAAALRIVQPLADQGEAKFQGLLGLMYSEGWGVTQSYGEAMRWYRRAADQGDALAQSFVGFMYRDGKGVAKDYVRAYVWFNLAAQSNEPADEPGHYTPARMAAQSRDFIASKMPPAQIAEARELIKKWGPNSKQWP